jgi:hypothetical protein
MDWVWELYKDYIKKYLRRMRIYEPDESQLQETFIKVLSESTITILVQEPWQNAVRFKGLKRDDVSKMMPLIQDPMPYLLENFGGGKFKINFHQGLNFIATINFKPDGEPRWTDLPSIPF